jgi:hypothetical protein
MTNTSSRPAGRQKRQRPFVPLLTSLLIGCAAIVSVAYLLQPDGTWSSGSAVEPDTLPVTVGQTLFNVPSKAIRMKLQKRTGPQERVDLYFVYPTLEPPEPPKHVTATTATAEPQPAERIFLSIIAHHGSTPPKDFISTIYPRYLEPSASTVQDILMVQAFRDGTPYAGEDLYLADGADFAARCTRDGETPGMCMSVRRIGDADLNFRFPRA